MISEKINLSNQKEIETSKNFIKFIIPSLLGILIFMSPIKIDGELTIPIAFFSDIFISFFGENIPLIVSTTIIISSILSVGFRFFNFGIINNNLFLKNLFKVSDSWLIVRAIGGLFAFLTIFEIGPDMIWSLDTGGLLLYDLMPILFTVFIFAGLFIPLLLDFGLLEFVGVLLNGFMRPVFTLPGRASVDCIASWLGDGTIGVLLTSKQYEEGYYSQREAAVIGTTFSVVSITFCLVVIAQVGLASMFFPFYLTILASGLFAAFIVPRIPPLSRKKDIYISDSKYEQSEIIPQNYNSFSWGLFKAMEKSNDSKGFLYYLKKGIENILDMWLGVLPVVMAMGTIALIIAEFTPVFRILGLPFIPLLNILSIPEATEASQALVVGFADMFLPSLLGSKIESELTRFVIACVSVTQLIYMSEVGGLLLGSKIPITIKELFIIFIERTLITLPIIALVAHILF